MPWSQANYFDGQGEQTIAPTTRRYPPSVGQQPHNLLYRRNHLKRSNTGTHNHNGNIHFVAVNKYVCAVIVAAAPNPWRPQQPLHAATVAASVRSSCSSETSWMERNTDDNTINTFKVRKNNILRCGNNPHNLLYTSTCSHQ